MSHHCLYISMRKKRPITNPPEPQVIIIKKKKKELLSVSEVLLDLIK